MSRILMPSASATAFARAAEAGPAPRFASPRRERVVLQPREAKGDGIGVGFRRELVRERFRSRTRSFVRAEPAQRRDTSAIGIGRGLGGVSGGSTSVPASRPAAVVGRVLWMLLQTSLCQPTMRFPASSSAAISTTNAEPSGSHACSCSRIHCRRTGRKPRARWLQEDRQPAGNRAVAQRHAEEYSCAVGDSGRFLDSRQ